MTQSANPPRAVWIWYPGDFEIRLHEKVSVRRRSRGVMYPAFWRLDRHYSNVRFRFTYDLPHEETIRIWSEGTFSLYLDGKDNYRYADHRITLPAGRHEITVCVFNDAEIPALLIEGENVRTSSAWEADSYQDDWRPAASWIFDSPENRPSKFRLAEEPRDPETVEIRDGFPLLDFGRETFGRLRFHGLKGAGRVSVYYGESRAEALSPEHCCHLDRFGAEEARGRAEDGVFTLEEPRAFRYVMIQADPGVEWDRVSMMYEYVPVEYRGSFACSDPLIEEIQRTALYTLHLNTREFFLDGIKRDFWVWSGDAYQAFLMNYYSFFDTDVTRRTLVALRGKDPVVKHINTILDYSLYWFISLHDYYLYTGDAAFIRQYWDRAVTLMDRCLQQRDAEGFLVGRPGDWVFVDWADIENTGAVSTIQLLFARSLEAMRAFAELAGDEAAAERYGSLSEEIREKTIRLFWDDERGGLAHRRVDGANRPELTRHANMFALIFGYLAPEQRESVIRRVLLNPEVPAIRTPYMRFHEMAALCEAGLHDRVLREIRDYWGGMIRLGATTFWEEYDPSLSDDAHYGMYGMPFGKSLCHAWGAGPVYLFGRYFLGVVPTAPGYAAYRVEPKLGDLERMEGTVPTPGGRIAVAMDRRRIRVESTHGRGTLVFASAGRPVCEEGEIRPLGDGRYEMAIEPGRRYTVAYLPLR